MQASRGCSTCAAANGQYSGPHGSGAGTRPSESRGTLLAQAVEGRKLRHGTATDWVPRGHLWSMGQGPLWPWWLNVQSGSDKPRFQPLASLPRLGVRQLWRVRLSEDGSRMKCRAATIAWSHHGRAKSMAHRDGQEHSKGICNPLRESELWRGPWGWAHRSNHPLDWNGSQLSLQLLRRVSVVARA